MNSISTENNTKKITGEEGFTILEIIVALTIFMIVTGSIWGVLKAAGGSRGVVNQQIPMQKNIRLALNVIGRDTYNAGYGYPVPRVSVVKLPDNRLSALIGIPNDFDTDLDRVPPIMAGNDRNVDNWNTVANTMTDQVTFMFKDSTFNLVGTGNNSVSTPLNISAPTTSANIVEIALSSGSNSACRVNDIYLIVGNNGSALGLSTGLNGTTGVQFSNGDVLGFNQTGATGQLGTVTTPASMVRVKMVTYFVASDGTLTRREFANVPPVLPAVAFVDEPLIYNVDNFQIKYIMDDGTVSDNPSAGPDAIPGNADDVAANMAAVRQIRFTVSVRSSQMYSTYSNANSLQPYRETMTSTFSTRNLGYDVN